MGELYGCDKAIILRYAKEIGYVNHYRNSLTEEQKQDILAQYELKTSKELSEYYGVSQSLITKTWSENGLIGKERRSYPFDFNYFENIDSADKAYFLGLLAADGNVFKRKIGNSQSIIKLSLQKTDKIILEIFKIYLGSKQPLYETRRESSYVNYMYTLELVSDKMANDLSKYNIIPYKTYDYEFVELNKEYMSHFFRGYFDGDGSISCVNNQLHSPSMYSIQISGFIHNLSKMSKYLFTNEAINSIIIIDKRKEKENKYNLPFGSLAFTNINDKYKFLKYIYDDRSDIYFARKRYMAECFLNAINKNYSNKQNLYNNILMPS